MPTKPNETSGEPNLSTADESSEAPDPRLNAYNADVADSALQGRVEARRFAVPVPHRLVEGVSEMMRAEPDPAAAAVSELLPGQRFDIVDDNDGWAFGYSAHDHYVGYVRSEFLRSDAPTRTHRIIAPLALCFQRPDIKSGVTMTLPLGAEIAAEQFDENFLRHRNGTFVHRRHVGAIEAYAPDHMEIAEFFLGTPYKWGGRSRSGIDCSGLVQVALSACGIFVPRDSDLQAAEIGEEIDPAELRRGDLVFFPGHVGFMEDETRLLHANAHWMTTLIEPLDDVVRRLSQTSPNPVAATRRITP
ncbi:hypothetical protein B5C34_10985 [Pacificimonas flava]|uniref:NlpC/P60 domain-containing protein n=2 Tax=Pacificimonas TaxID=1960290 RepID=A0A219B6Y4_9SPHN|nr:MULTISPECIES: C40 family peptidase [Pacificimonas]MBZ6378806.1 C40 family peptidase [Pacificimonas aurantium]OWV33934.1 hypothetical protein B5C34_10985 [Pacificimonas flava]